MWWGFLVDALFILIILTFAIIGIAKGFFDSLLGLISTGVALLVSIFTAKYLANFINKIFGFQGIIENALNKSAENGAISLFGKITLSTTDVAKFTVWIISIVIIFLLIKLVVFILAKIFEAVTKNSPTISGLNRVFGMVFGVIRGGVFAVILMALMSLLSGVTLIGTPIYNTMANAKVTGGIFKYVDDFVQKDLTLEKVQDIVGRIAGTSNESGSEG